MLEEIRLILAQCLYVLAHKPAIKVEMRLIGIKVRVLVKMQSAVIVSHQVAVRLVVSGKKVKILTSDPSACLINFANHALPK